MSNLQDDLNAINKRFGANSAFTFSNYEVPELDKVSSGSLTLDLAVGGGLPYGRIVEIYGPESCGKTTIALQTLANAQKEGKNCAFVDFEHAFDKTYATSLGINTDDLIFSQPTYAEQGLNIVEALIDTVKVNAIVIDSVAAMVPKAELEGDMEDQKMGVHARLMNKALRKITGKAHKNDVLLIFINQTREKIGVMFGNPTTTTGGNGLKFYSSIRLAASKSQGDSEDEFGNKSNIKVTVKVVKNKVFSPDRKAIYYIGYGTGIDYLREVVDLAVERKIVNKSGSWYSYGENKIGQGTNKVKEFLESHPGLLEEIVKKINESLDI